MDVYLFDEPFSALDAISEQHIIKRLNLKTKMSITIFITHRYSSLRLADFILVLKDGELVESGSHQELQKAGKYYSELINAQIEPTDHLRSWMRPKSCFGRKVFRFFSGSLCYSVGREVKAMKRPKVTGLRRRESWQALPFLLPSLLGLCLFYLFPLAETVRASFMDPLRSRAVGWGNYRALFQNTAFRLAVRNTCRFLCICIPALLAVSLLCAVLLGAAKRRAVFFKSVLLLPYAIPVASIVVLWRALFSGKGQVNGLLVGLGCRPVDFMGSSAAFWVLIFTYLWRNNGYDMLLWLAGLETIPRPLYEAAAVDGATPFQTFVFITLPNLLPTVVLTTILSLVNSFKVFREAYLVAGNYPQESIYLLQHLFNNWFLSLDIGKLSAAAVLLALGLGCVVYLLYHFWGGGQE